MASLLHPGEFVRDAVAGAIDKVGTWIIDPMVEVILFTPVPLHHGELALIRRPTNAPWPQIYDFAFTNVLPLVFTLLILGYALAYALRAVPGVGYQRQQIRGNIISAMIVTPWAWPLGVGVLALMDGLIKAIAPESANLAKIVISQLGLLIGAAAAPGPNILAAGVGFVDIGMLVLTLILYAIRFIYIFGFMLLIYLIAAVYLADFPILKGVSAKLFRIFVKLAYAPLFVAAVFRLSTFLWVTAEKIDISGLSALPKFALGALSLVIPFSAVFVFVGVLASSTGAAGGIVAGSAATAVAGRLNGKSLGSLGNPDDDDYEGAIEERAANLDEKLQDSTKRYTKTAGQRVDDHMAEAGTRPSEGISSGISRINDATPDGPRDAARSAASTAKRAQASISTSLDSIFPDSDAEPPETTAEPAEPLTDEAGDVMGPSGGAVTPINPPDTDTQGVIVGTGADETSEAGQPSLGSFFPSEAPPGEAPPAETDTPEPPATDTMSELDPTAATAPDEPVEQDGKKRHPDSGWTHVDKTHLERAAESHPEWSRSDLIKRLNETEQRDGRKAAERKAYQLATGQAAAESATTQDVGEVPPDSIPDETTDTQSAAPETTTEDASQEPADTVTSTRLAGEDSSDSSGGRDPVEVIDPNEYLDREYDKEPPLLPEEVADD